jgi:hypothetical protein
MVLHPFMRQCRAGEVPTCAGTADVLRAMAAAKDAPESEILLEMAGLADEMAQGS